MADFDAFKEGEHVAHITRGDGAVLAIEDGCVVVRFERRPEAPGRYDRRWFELNPRFLFHRNTQPVSEVSDVA